ncbi:MAG: radical SAM protein, partial [Pseudomonadota bacterium]
MKSAIFSPDGLPHPLRKGRGAITNVSGRFEKEKREAFDDGWETEDLPPLKTDVQVERPKTIITRNES